MRPDVRKVSVVAHMFDACPGSQPPLSCCRRSRPPRSLQLVQRRRAADAAYEAELICRLADLTPDVLDPDPDSPGGRRGSWAPDTELPGVSEFFPAELAVLLNCGRGTAAVRARRAWTFRESLPATRAAMAA